MLFTVGPLPDDPLAAAAAFHAEVLPGVLMALHGSTDHLTLVFAAAGHPHEDWRRAVVATLARERTPMRINAIAGNDEGAIAGIAAFIAGAPGLTGQYLVADATGAG